MGPELWGQVQGQSQAGSLDQTQLPCSPSWFSPTTLTLEHLENGQRVIEAWGRIAEWWMGLGQTHTDEISSLMPLPPGPFRRDGLAMAVLPPASCPHHVCGSQRAPAVCVQHDVSEPARGPTSGCRGLLDGS